MTSYKTYICIVIGMMGLPVMAVAEDETTALEEVVEPRGFDLTADAPEPPAHAPVAEAKPFYRSKKVKAQSTAPSVEQRLAVLEEARLKGEISGEQYLAERKRVIHGHLAATAPADAGMSEQLANMSTEQQLDLLMTARARGELDGDDYLEERQRILDGL